MNLIYTVSLLILGLLMCICAVLFLVRKSLTAKLQISLPFNTLAIMFMSVYFYSKNQSNFLDITILYALLSYVSILAFCKYYKMHVSKVKRRETSSTKINKTK